MFFRCIAHTHAPPSRRDTAGLPRPRSPPPHGTSTPGRLGWLVIPPMILPTDAGPGVLSLLRARLTPHDPHPSPESPQGHCHLRFPEPGRMWATSTPLAFHASDGTFTEYCCSNSNSGNSFLTCTQWPGAVRVAIGAARRLWWPLGGSSATGLAHHNSPPSRTQFAPLASGRRRLRPRSRASRPRKPAAPRPPPAHHLCGEYASGIGEGEVPRPATDDLARVGLVSHGRSHGTAWQSLGAGQQVQGPNKQEPAGVEIKRRACASGGSCRKACRQPPAGRRQVA